MSRRHVIPLGLWLARSDALFEPALKATNIERVLHLDGHRAEPALLTNLLQRIQLGPVSRVQLC
ncbi:hypothetical protein AXW83_21755 [Bosea sp. PAMC 26642]|nr:hypothetical protein AXW83_21755 [Bosea sp. PAMC 26642]